MHPKAMCLFLSMVLGLRTSKAVATPNNINDQGAICATQVANRIQQMLDTIARIGQWENVVIITDNNNIHTSSCPMVQLACNIDKDVLEHELKALLKGFLNIILYCPNVTRAAKSVLSEGTLRWFTVTMIIIDESPLDAKATALNFGVSPWKKGDLFVRVRPYSNKVPRKRNGDCNITLQYQINATTPSRTETTRWFHVSKALLSRRRLLQPGRAFSLPDGLHLDVIGSQYQPFFYEQEDGSYGGLDVDLIDALSIALGFSYQFSYQEDAIWGGPLPNGSWIGMLSKVYYGTKDVAISGITVTSKRLQGVDFTRQHAQDPVGLMFKLHTEESLFFIHTFDFKVWIAVFAMPIVCISLYLIWDALYYQSLDEKDVESRGQTMLDIWGNLFAQGRMPPIRNSGQALIVAGYVLTIVAVLAIYTGNLTASLAIKHQSWPFTTLRGFADSDYKLYIAKGSQVEQVLRDSQGSLQKKLWAKVKKYSSTHLITFDPRLGINSLDLTNSLFGIDKLYLEGQTQSDCDLVLLPEDMLGSMGMGLVVSKYSPLKSAFDPIILRLAEMGLIDYWLRKHKPIDICSKQKFTRQPKAVSLADMSTAFQAVVGGGIGLSTFVLACEVLTHRSLTRIRRIKTVP